MAPSACLSPVVTLALLLLITGFALGGEFIFSTNLAYSYNSNITHRQFVHTWSLLLVLYALFPRGSQIYILFFIFTVFIYACGCVVCFDFS